VGDDEILKLEIFTLDDLQVNITEHDMVPRHSVLSEDEKQQLLSQYKI